MTDIVIFEERLPSVIEYNTLRKAVSWPVLDDSATESGLQNSFYCICAVLQNEVIAFGRIVGDGAIYFHIQDVIVHPKLQRLGIGQAIMSRLMKYIETKAAANAMAGLMCSKGREEFYKQFGFIERPNERFGAGMVKVY